MKRLRAVPRERTLVALVGWLFADLMLVIMIVALGSQKDPELAVKAQPKPTATPTPTHSTPTTSTPSSKPSPSPTTSTARVGPQSVDKAPVQFTVDDSGGTPQLTTELKNQLKPYHGRHAGFVLTFGWGPDPQADTAYATSIDHLLTTIDPAMFPSDTVLRPFVDLDHANTGTAEIQIYFYTTAVQ
ncbi:hypothetical protein [Catenulispora rubra]|uniref:hypothetical protein n=1 Tax=Catenulispora rubra TaxID=280293 RepID=UPI001892859C|nr:hypothetical protein [Catenulispora rubra]